jgi:hypothetical protein
VRDLEIKKSPGDEPISEGATDSEDFEDEFSQAKREVEISAADVHSPDSLGPPHNDTRTPQGRLWKALFFCLGPLSGIFAMLVAALSIIVSFGILMGSRGKPEASWVVPPSAYLAICTAVANQAMRYAAFQGVMVAWWSGALRGSTLARLHTDWRAGTTVIGALATGRHMGLLGLACIFSTLVAIDGPLLQKATTIVAAPIVHHPVPLDVTLAPEVPAYSTGWWQQTYGDFTHWAIQFNDTIPTSYGSTSNNIISVLRDTFEVAVGSRWFMDAPISGVVRGCPGVCKAKLRAPALVDTSCTSYLIPVNYTAPTRPGAMESHTRAPLLDKYAFIISTSLLVDQHERINLVTGSSQTKGCVGMFNYTACTLESAVGEYDVTVDGDTFDLDPPGMPTIVALANNTRVSRDNITIHYPSTLAGIVQSAYLKWDSAVLYFTDYGMTDIASGNGHEQFLISSDPVGCQNYADPGEEVRRTLNKLMVYTGVAAARHNASYLHTHMDPDLVVNSTVTGYLHGTHNVFHTNLWWLLGAAIVEAICIALILPTYFGFWRLGRPVSFSPLEIAKICSMFSEHVY